jgi:hypothetical protein
MSAFPDLRSLVVRTVHDKYMWYAKSITKEDWADAEDEVVRLRPRRISDLDGDVVFLPVALLLSICVLLSIWEDSEHTHLIDDLLNVLMRSDVSEVEDLGLASATIGDSSQSAVTVESVGAYSRVSN